jgi:hypothetical protein
MPDIALGIFFGWFLIRFWIKFTESGDEFWTMIEKYFEAKKKAEETLKEHNK